MSIKVGVIGCGFIAMFKHFPALAEVEDLEIVAFCDIIPEKASMMAGKYGTVLAKVTADYRELLDNPEIDVVHICTPNNTHCEITCAALEKGKHVMCEKPMAVTSEEAEKMAETARRVGKKLTIGYQNRFREDTQFMKRMVEAGDLGEIYFSKALACRRRGVPTWGVFTDKQKQGGGPLIDLATHALDITLWMMDDYEPELVMGQTFNKIGRKGSPANIGGSWDAETFEVEDSAFGMIRMKNGHTINIESSWVLNTLIANEASVILCGTEGGADMFPADGPAVRESDAQATDKLHIRYNGESHGKLFSKNYSLGGVFIGNEKKEVMPGGLKECHSWYNAIRSDKEVVVKPEQAVVVTRILEAVYQSAARGKAVNL